MGLLIQSSARTAFQRLSQFERIFYPPQLHLSPASGGASVGQYGPVLHFGSSVGALVRSVLPTKLNPEVYVACGAAAAISAGFGAPIAGVVFACEAILRHFSVRALAPIIVSSSIWLQLATRLFFDRSSPYIVDVSGLDWNLLPLVLLLGASSALVAVLLCHHYSR